MRNIWPVIFRSIGLLANIIFTVVVGRLTDISSAGQFFTWFTVITIAAMCGRRGSDMYALKHAKFTANASPAVISSLWMRAIWGSTLAAIVLLSAVAIFGLSGARTTQEYGSIALMAISMPLNSFSVVNSSILRANGRASSGALIEVGLTQIIATGLLCAFTVIGQMSGFAASAIAYFAGSAATAALSYVLLTNMCGTVANQETHLSMEARREMNFMATSAVLFFGLTWLPVFCLWLAAQPRQVALFTAANRLIALLPIVTTLQMTAALPQVAALSRHGQQREASETLVRLSKYATAACLVAATTFLLFARPLVDLLFGGDYADASETLRWAGLLQAFTVMLGPVSLVLSVVGLEKESTRLGAIAILLGTPACLFAAKEYGATGAATVGAAIQATFSLIGGLLLARRGLVASIFFTRLKENNEA